MKTQTLIALLLLLSTFSIQPSALSSDLPPNFPKEIPVIIPDKLPLNETQILNNIAAYKIGGDRTALLSLRALAAQAAADTASADALAAKLAKTAEAQNTTRAARVALVETIGLLRANTQVPYLEKYLLDKNLSLAAAGALQQIATPEARAALARALAKATDTQAPQLLAAAAAIPDNAYLPSIRKHLAGKNPDTQLAALRALAANPAPETLQQLLALRDKLPPALQTHYETALLQSLKNPGTPAARETALKQLLASNQPQNRRAAYLEQLNDATPGQLARLIQSKDTAQQTAALVIITQNPKKIPPAQLADLLSKLDDPTLEKLLAATKTAATPELLPVLAKHLSNKNTGIARQAAEAIGHIPTPEALDTLLRQAAATKDPDQIARINAALDKLPPALAPQLRAALDNPSPAVQQIAIAQLTRLNDATIVPALLDKLPSADRATAAQILNALGALATVDNLPPLLRLLSAKTAATPERIRAAILRIASRQPAATQTQLEQNYDKLPPPAQTQIIEIYAALQTPAALAQLTKILSAQNSDQRKAALRALGSVKTPDAIQPLLEHARQAADPAEKILALRALAQLLERPEIPAATRQTAAQTALPLCTRDEEKQSFQTLLKK